VSLFSLGTIDPLLVDSYDGFAKPTFVQRVRLLSSGGDGPHEVIQSSGIPFPTAVIAGTLTESADCAALRDYDLSKELVTFTDGAGATYSVRVLELSIRDETDYWTFGATLIDTATIVVGGS
jgi:hypothetical protein